MLGPQCREHEVDLSGPHPDCCHGKNPVDEPPNSFEGKRMDREQSCLLVVTGVLSQPLQHPGRAQRDPGALVPPALHLPQHLCPVPACTSPRAAWLCPRVGPITTGVSWQVNFFLFLSIVRVLASKLWETTTGKLDPRQQYRQVLAAPKPHGLPAQPGWLPELVKEEQEGLEE